MNQNDDNQSMISKYVYQKSNDGFQFKFDVYKGTINGLIVKKEDSRLQDNYDAFRKLLERQDAAKLLISAGQAYNMDGEARKSGFANKNKIKSSIVIEQGDNTSFVSDNYQSQLQIDQQLEELQIAKEKINYAEGIRVMRLNKEGRVLEFFPEDEEKMSSEEDEEVQINDRKKQKAQSTIFNNDSSKQTKGGNRLNIIGQNGRNSRTVRKKKDEVDTSDLINTLKKKSELSEKLNLLVKNRIIPIFIIYLILAIATWIGLSRLYIYYQK